MLLSTSVFFKFLCHILQQLANGQMLRTDLFTLAALHAVRRPAPRRGMHFVIIEIRVPAVVELLGVQGGEEVGYV